MTNYREILRLHTVRQFSFGLHRNTCGTSCTIILVQDFVRIPWGYFSRTPIQKRASGYPYHTSSKILGYLDTMIADDYPDCSSLSKEICDTWIRKCSVLHQNTLLRQVTPVRQFAKYLVGTGKSAYIIPSGIPRKQIRYPIITQSN